MKALRQQIAVTAPTNGRVLIYGESGTGKELVARALHANSLRSKGPFVEVSCAAIPEELIESELFGHVKGSFSGATDDKIGKFQKADGGTLFLDEVGDMSLRTQSKVLRVLEEQRIEPIGSNQTLRVDVRVIAATNKNLEQEIARGAFRQDLFYRLNVIPFHVPPLRDRNEDIPVLARFFLNEFSAEYGKKTRELSDGALEILVRYPWPGNVRELKNLVERLVIVCPQARIEPHHLPPELFRGVAESPQHPVLHPARSPQRLRARVHSAQAARTPLEHDANGLRARPGALAPLPQNEIAGNRRARVIQSLSNLLAWFSAMASSCECQSSSRTFCGFSRQSATTFTNIARKIFVPSNVSNSFRAAVPIFFSISPLWPIRIFFCESRSTCSVA